MVGYNNEILISTGLTLGKNGGVNVGVKEEHPTVPPHTDHKVQPNTAPKVQPHTVPKVHDSQNKVTHEEEKIALILFLVAGFTVWCMF